MSGVFVSCALSALLISVALSDQPHHHHHHHQESELSFQKLSSPNADFAFALYKKLNAKATAGENIFFSPLSISTALSALSTGVRGKTHSQLFSSLGYSTFNQTQVNEAYKHLLHKLGQNLKNEQLDIGNALALRSDFIPLEKFLRDVKHYYSGDIFSVDLTKPDAAVAEINTYIANKTHDKIKDMVKELEPDMVMMLINYVYFRGLWKNPFSRHKTNSAEFHVDKNTTVQVDMMSMHDDFKVYRDADNHTTIIILPYESKTSMMIVLPDEEKMQEVEGSINKDYVRHWCNSVSDNYVELFLPRFSISAEASLANTLKEMGITDVFDHNGDFSGVSEEVKLKVSKVSHKATLSVTELGTEAAAATTIEMVYLSAILSPSIEINRPFLLFILENCTENLLFMGKINNPAVM